MTNLPTVTAVCGSLREGSCTRIALRLLLEEVRKQNAEANLVDLRAYDLPVYDADRDRSEAGDAERLAEEIRSSDSIILGTPMYHGSYSSPLKTALDYCGFDEFEDKTVGLLAVSGGSFPVPALEHLRTVCRALNAWVIPHQVAIPEAHGAAVNGEIEDEDLRERIRVLGRRAVQYTSIEPDPPSFQSWENVGAEQ